MQFVLFVSTPSKNASAWEPLLSKTRNVAGSTLLSYAASIGIIVLITLLGLPIRLFVRETNLAMLYLLGVVIVALWLGRGPAVLTAVLSMFALDVVFVPPYFDMFSVDVVFAPPYFNLIINDAPSLLAFIGLLVVALVIGTLTARAQEHARIAQRRERLTTASYQLSLELASAADREAILYALIHHTQQIAVWEVAVFLREEGEIVEASATDGYQEGFHGRDLATQLIEGHQKLEPSSQILVQAQTGYLPLRRGNEIDGVLSVQPLPDDHGLTVEQHQLLWAFASQAALALERARLADQARKAEMAQVAEHLQAALLSSISHNLRTPLASIAATLSSLQEPQVHFDETTQQELIATAWQEANHLNQLLGNLLDMSRLESGVIRVQPEPCDVQDLIGVALSEVRDRLGGHNIETHVPEELTLIPMDFVLMVQVVVNLLDNAIKYSPPGSSITLSALRADEHMEISVTDQGPGIPPQEQTRIFDKFYRGGQRDGVGGTGLGLSIVKGIVDAHEGDISMHSVVGEGTTFTVRLPVPVTTATADLSALDTEDRDG